ncbi:MAG: hypothetical protein GY928_39005 [Colwellia sp.]|nr:hypothetical protein [Colwellia sp.]
MTIGKDTQSGMLAYTGLLSGLKIGGRFFSKLNHEFTKLLMELFKRLMETNQLDRKEEFLDDFKMFTNDMLRKYGTTDPYGHSPRSPFEKRMGIEPQPNSYRKRKLIGSSNSRTYDTDGYLL